MTSMGNLDREYFLKQSGYADLWTRHDGHLPTGKGVTVAQVENGLADPAHFDAAKVFHFMPGSTGGGDSHANTVGDILYSAAIDFGLQMTMPSSLSPDVRDIHGWTSTQFRTDVLALTSTGARTGALPSFPGVDIDVLNISNTMGNGGEVNTVRGLDYLIDTADVLACTAQPGTTEQNATGSGVLWNSLVVGTTTAFSSHTDGAQYENVNGVKRRKPDITACSSLGFYGGASSWSTPVVSSGAALLLERARATPDTLPAAKNYVLKAIIMAGAVKTGLFPTLTVNGQPDGIDYATPYAWANNPPTVPLDPLFGVGQFNVNLAYAILEAGPASPSSSSHRLTGWVHGQGIRSGPDRHRYSFVLDKAAPEFSSALVWNRHIQDLNGSSYGFSVADLRLELWSDDSKLLIAASDDPGNNVEHIYLPAGLPAGTYFLEVSSHSNFAENYGLAWRTMSEQAQPKPRLRPLITRSATWKYRDNGVDLGTSWIQPNYDDNAWASGPARLGYGGDGEKTTVSFGSDPNQKHITTYFRHSFVMPQDMDVTALSMFMQYDDGIVIYFNGTELFRFNLPSGPINAQTLATTDREWAPNFWGGSQISTTYLRPGLNVIAVEVHQAAPNSDDLGFALELSGGGYPSGPVPKATIARRGVKVEVSWPSIPIRYRPYAAPTLLTPLSQWSPLGDGPTVRNGTNVVSLTPAGSSRFFQLRRP